ncbi:MAG: NAD(P)-dependent oxidoreductase [Bacilli bacterium]|nr:NAD(P)-dependent oxidoreductase [Bacilli bacterium]
MSILVTGGHGFVGMHIVNELIDIGKNVVVVDVLEKVPSILEPVKEKYIYESGDITDMDYLTSIIEKYRIEGIIHLAAIKNNKQCTQNPMLAFNVNLLSTINIFELARIKKLKRIITLSSAVVFSHWGDSNISVRETDTPSPENLYSTLKYSVEQFARIYRGLYNVPIVIVRISRVYGPGVVAPLIPKESNPIPQLLWDVIKNKSINQETGGDFEADFSYVKDVAHGINLSYLSDTLPSPILHIGGGEMFKVRDIINIIQEISPDIPAYIGSSTEPYSTQAPIRGTLDISLANKELGYSPQYTLKEGLVEYKKWLEKEAKFY